MENVIYIAGPMTALPAWNYPAFNEAARELRDLGFEVLNPAEHFDGATDRERSEYLRSALNAVTQATMIVLLPGWEESEGVTRELQVADAANIPVYDYAEFVHYAEQVEYGFDTKPPQQVTRRAAVPPRAEVLHEAASLITGDRNAQYGSPQDDFGRSVGMWNALGYRGPGGRELQPSDLSILLICVKLSRATWMNKRDNWTDIAGYSGCGYEVGLAE
jgi:hypothetical protein